MDSIALSPLRLAGLNWHFNSVISKKWREELNVCNVSSAADFALEWRDSLEK